MLCVQRDQPVTTATLGGRMHFTAGVHNKAHPDNTNTNESSVQKLYSFVFYVIISIEPPNIFNVVQNNMTAQKKKEHLKKAFPEIYK